MDWDTELVVVGAGPAGVAATLMAASVGVRTALVESAERVGGTPWSIGALANVPGGWRDGPALAEALEADVARLVAEGRCTLVRGRAERVSALEGRAEVALTDGRVLTGAATVVATGVVPLGPADVTWAEAPDGAGLPPLWRTGADAGHAVVLGGDRPLGTWLRAHPEAAARLEVLYPAQDTYKIAEIADEPRVRLYETERAEVRGEPGDYEVTAHGPEGARTLRVPRVLVNIGAGPHPPAGDLIATADGYFPAAAQRLRVLTAGDLRSPRHQRIVTAQGSGAEAALTCYYAAHR